MDLEPSYTDAASIKPQSTPSPRLRSTRCNKRKVAKRLHVRDPVARPAHRAIRNARINCEAYGSPEPKDMEF
ncbi:hypothetical protein F4776DRAFT_641359 [Hypoxylon sp. NC0597]|nr:hypothetical protein F4776DRAFT_641359 [Hypoxylon sp. NC0597]